MAKPLDRNEIIELLNRLGGDRDEDVLEAARAAHSLIDAAGADWDELLVNGESDVEDESAIVDEASEPAAKGGGKGGSRKLIEKLLAGKGVSASLRQELKDYLTDIEEGDFDEADARYISALAKRLSKG